MAADDALAAFVRTQFVEICPKQQPVGLIFHIQLRVETRCCTRGCLGWRACAFQIRAAAGPRFRVVRTLREIESGAWSRPRRAERYGWPGLPRLRSCLQRLDMRPAWFLFFPSRLRNALRPVCLPRVPHSRIEQIRVLAPQSAGVHPGSGGTRNQIRRIHKPAGRFEC